MDRRNDTRAQELSNLRLALATFAVQLDVFEMRMAAGMAAVPFRAGIKSGIRVPQPDIRYRFQKERNDCSSIKSPGNKPDE
jgi:hypothetical protein